MKIILEKNLKQFTTIMKIISSVWNEPMLLFSDEGLKVYASMSGMVVSCAIFKKEYFEVFENTGDELYRLDGRDILTGLSKSNKWSEMEYVDSFIVQRTDKITFKMPVYENVDDPMRIPELVYSNYIELPMSTLSTALKGVKGFTESHVDLIVKDNKFIVTAGKNQREIVIEVCDVIHPNVKVSMQFDQTKIIAQEGSDNAKLYLE